MGHILASRLLMGNIVFYRGIYSIVEYFNKICLNKLKRDTYYQYNLHNVMNLANMLETI